MSPQAAPATSGGSKRSISSAAIVEFKDAIEQRRLVDAKEAFRTLKPFIASLSPADDQAAVVTDYCARLLDHTSEHKELVKQLLFLFTQTDRRKLSAVDVVRLDLAEGIVALHEERLDDGADLLKLTVKNSERLGSEDLMAMSRYYLARYHHRQGHYSECLTLCRTAKDLLKDSRYKRAVAVIGMVEAWSLFVKGDSGKAESVLNLSAKELTGNSDYLEDCNVASFRGLIASQKGLYEKAIGLFRSAILKFDQNRNAKHPNCGRVHVHLAFAKLYWARQLARQKVRANQREQVEKQIEDLMSGDDGAVFHLDKAFKIYGDVPCRGLVRVCAAATELDLDQGYFYKARAGARKARKIADSTEDPVAKAYARLVQCEVEIETGTGDASKCLTWAKESLSFSDDTERRRLKAQARIRLGRILLGPPFSNFADARRYFDEADELMRPADMDELRAEFEDFKEEIKGASSARSTVATVTQEEALARGLEPTLQHVEQKIVLKIYQAMGGSLNKTAEILNTTRSRVRRVLRRPAADSRPDSNRFKAID